MNRVFTYLGRFAVIVIGFTVAALAASAFMHLLVLGSLGFRPEDAPWVMTGSVVFSIPFVALFVGYFAFLPALVVIMIAELMAKRDWLFHALGGAAVGLAVAAMFWNSELPYADGSGAAPDRPLVDPTFADPRFIGLILGAGLVGGIAYWLVAGRFSGNWRERLGAPPAGNAPGQGN